MAQKTAHWLYSVLLLLSVAITGLSSYIPEKHWSSVVMSVGCGGIASVCVAWLIDYRNHRSLKAENDQKYASIIRQYVRLFHRLLRVSANECHGLYHDNHERSLQEWLDLLCEEEKYSVNDKNPTMEQRCVRLSGSVFEIQEYIGTFLVQSATLIINGYPDIDKVLDFFEVQRVHCWGTLKQLECYNYKAFCDTIYILYKEFLEHFPQCKNEFPEKYNLSTLK